MSGRLAERRAVGGGAVVSAPPVGSCERCQRPLPAVEGWARQPGVVGAGAVEHHKHRRPDTGDWCHAYRPLRPRAPDYGMLGADNPETRASVEVPCVGPARD